MPEPTDYAAVARFLLGHPNIASRAWVAEQYDSMIGTNTTTTNAPADAAVVRIKGTTKAIAITVDCNARYVHADPQQGCAIAVAEAARNIVCAGGEPVAVTNCLNFGNPYDPEVYWQFVQAIQGMKKACERFGTAGHRGQRELLQPVGRRRGGVPHPRSSGCSVCWKTIGTK